MSCCPFHPDPHPNPNPEPKPQFNLINDKIEFAIIGDASTGKTSLLLRKVKDEFLENTNPTVIDGIDIMYQDAKNNETKFHIYDTGGQLDYRDIPASYIKHSNGIIIVCSYDMGESVKNLIHWKELIEENRDLNETTLYVILNKSDLKDSNPHLYDDVDNWAQENNALFFETSAKDDPQSVRDAFDSICESFLSRSKKQEKE